MKFDDIVGNRRLWAVKYYGDEMNVLTLLFQQWSDIEWLVEFFTSNMVDLERKIEIFRI